MFIKFLVGHLYGFIQGKILDNFRDVELSMPDISDINSFIFLGTGPPYKILTNFNSTLNEAGFFDSTRVIVCCKEFAYQKNLAFENT